MVRESCGSDSGVQRNSRASVLLIRRENYESDLWCRIRKEIEESKKGAGPVGPIGTLFPGSLPTFFFLERKAKKGSQGSRSVLQIDANLAGRLRVTRTGG
jgi:hypothetical protein